MVQLLANNAASTLASGITAAATTLTLATGTGSKFPSPTNGDWFPLTLDDGTNVEILRCTARINDDLTVSRAHEGTAASAFAATTKAELRLTIGSMVPRVETLTAASGNWVGPIGVTAVWATIVAGGGGGSAGDGTTGGRGGGGGQIRRVRIAVTPGQSYNYTIGAGGLGATSANAAGGNGGSSQFAGVYANGGGGAGSTDGNPGAYGGGVIPLANTQADGTTAPYGCGGTRGGINTLGGMAGGSANGPGGPAGTGAASTTAGGGGGGSWGGGGSGGSANASGTGYAGRNAAVNSGGGGGGGGGGTTTHGNGGNGGSGVIFLEY